LRSTPFSWSLADQLVDFSVFGGARVDLQSRRMHSRIAVVLATALAVSGTTGYKRIAEKVLGDKELALSGDGTVSVKGSGAAKLPDGWPSAVLMYPGAKVKSASKSGDTHLQYLSANQETGDGPDAVLTFYGEKLAAAGFTKASTGNRSASFRKGTRGEDGSISVSVSAEPAFADPSKNAISLSITSLTTSTLGTAFPAGWPSEIPAYPKGTFKAASTSATDHSQTLAAEEETEDDLYAVLKFYTDKLTAAGYKQTAKAEGGIPPNVSITLTFQKGKSTSDDYRTFSVGVVAKPKYNIVLSTTTN
jgi:hypothetical protein